MAKNKHNRKQAEPKFDVTDVVIEQPVVENATTEVATTEAPVEQPVVENATTEAKPVKVRYAKRVWGQNDVITLNTPNPKSGKSKERYDRYVTGMTVAEYATAIVNMGGSKTLANADLRWDVARNHITIEAAPAPVEPKAD